MSIAQITPAALKLPPDQRAALAESLWESLEDPYCIPIADEDAAALRLSDQRDRELEEGTVAPLAHDDLMRRLRA